MFKSKGTQADHCGPLENMPKGDQQIPDTQIWDCLLVKHL